MTAEDRDRIVTARRMCGSVCKRSLMTICSLPKDHKGQHGNWDDTIVWGSR